MPDTSVISQGISGLGPAEALIGVGRGYGAPGEARWRREISCSRDDVARPWTVLSGQVVVLGSTVCSTIRRGTRRAKRTVARPGLVPKVVALQRTADGGMYAAKCPPTHRDRKGKVRCMTLAKR